jgi:hypothetical protein
VDESQTRAATTAPGRATRAISQTPATRVLHQLDYELGKHGVELGVGERQSLRHADPHIGAGNPRPASLHERLGRIDRGHVARPEPFGEKQPSAGQGRTPRRAPAAGGPTLATATNPAASCGP